jgi:hypothetical protein
MIVMHNGHIVNHKLYIYICRERISPGFEIKTVGTEESHEKPQSGKPISGPNLNPEPPEYEFPTIHLRRSVVAELVKKFPPYMEPDG